MFLLKELIFIEAGTDDFAGTLLQHVISYSNNDRLQLVYYWKRMENEPLHSVTGGVKMVVEGSDISEHI